MASLPQSALASLAAGPAGGPGSGSGSNPAPFGESSAQAAPSGGSGIQGLSGNTGGLLGGLLNSARAVSGPWGSGRLLRSSLISVLITSHGRILVGAVTPAVLYRAVSLAGQPLTGSQRHAASRAAAK